MPINPVSTRVVTLPVDAHEPPSTSLDEAQSTAPATGWAPGVDDPRAAVTDRHAPLPSWPSGLDVDAPSLDLARTIGILKANFDTIAGESPIGSDDKISTIDLAIAAHDKSLPKDLRDAAAYLLQGNAARNALDTAAGKGDVDGTISRRDLDAAPGLLDATGATRILDTAAGRGGQDGHVSDADLSAALRDPTLPPDLRKSTAFSLRTDADLARIIGKPKIDPSLTPADQARVLHAYANLIRSSPLGAIEAKRITDYGTTLSLTAHGASTTLPDGSRITLSNDMIKGADGGAGVLAHEGGHVIFAKSGLKEKVDAQERNGSLSPHSASLLNEAFAGAFGNRVHLAWSAQLTNGDGTAAGKDLDAFAHLSLLADVLHNLRPGSFYAKYYGVDVGEALKHLDGIKNVIATDLIPYLRQNYPITDGDLGAGV